MQVNKSALLKIIITSALMAWVLSQVHLNEIADLFRSASWGWFFIALGVTLLQHLITARILQTLSASAGNKKKYLDMLEIMSWSFFFSLLGGLVGGIVRWRGLAGNAKRYAEAVFVIVIDNYQMLSAYGFFFTAPLFLSLPPEGFFTEFMILRSYGVLMLIGAALGWGLLQFRRIRIDIQKWVERFDLKSGLLGKAANFMAGIFKVFESTSGKSHDLNTTFALCLLHAALTAIVYILVFNALDIQIGWIDTLWISAVPRVIQLVPIAIAGLGVNEAALVLCLRMYGIESAQAVFAGLFMSFSAMFYSLLGGVWALSYSTLKKRAAEDGGRRNA